MNPLAPLAPLAQLALAQVGRYAPPSERDVNLVDEARFFVERYGAVLYPAVALIVITLIVAGILQAWRQHDLVGLVKVELKREIILELRKQVGGMSAETIARAINLNSFKTVKILEEMQRDGIIHSHTNTARLTTWRVKGVGGPMAR